MNKNIQEWLPAIVCSFCVGFAVLLWADHKFSQFDEELGVRPPIAIVSMEDMLKAVPIETPKEQWQTLMTEIDSSIGRLANAGYLVMPQQSILHAPAALAVPVEPMLTKVGIKIDAEFVAQGGLTKESGR